MRAIVTSRITLIEKATIPKDATIIRLLEFDEAQRNKWISVWNSANRNYFKQASVKRFQIPREQKIIDLAKQPLLLLMLALFDSSSNELHRMESLDMTALYENLLHRFIIREHEKNMA